MTDSTFFRMVLFCAFGWQGWANTAPITQPDNYTTDWDSVLQVAAPGLLANDVDPDGDTLETHLLQAPERGKLELARDGSFRYHPVSGFAGDVSFVYKAWDGRTFTTATATVSIGPGNQAPTAAADTYTLQNTQRFNLAAPGVLANDLDPEGRALTSYLLSTPPTGHLGFHGDGSLWFDPDPAFTGTTSFTYKVGDGQAYSEPTTVTLQIEAPDGNRAPLISSIPPKRITATLTYEYQPQAVDPEGETLHFGLVRSPPGMTIDETTGLLNWTPSFDQAGAHEVILTASDPAGRTVEQAFVVEVIRVDFSQPDTDFWLSFGPAGGSYNNRGWEVSVLITAERATSGVLEIPTNDTQVPFTVTPGVATKIPFNLLTTPWPQVLNRGIHVTALDNISVAAVHFQYFSSDSSAVYPTRSLSREYIILDHDAVPGKGLGSYLNVVATEPDTVVTLVPQRDVNIWSELGQVLVAAGEPYDFIIPQAGESFYFYTRLNSFIGAGLTADKPVSVASGHHCTGLPLWGFGACDQLYEQLPGIDQWSTTQFAVPFAGRRNGDIYRAVAAFDQTEIRVNGQVSALLDKGEWYEHIYHEPVVFESSHPILVAQFQMSASQDANTSPLGESMGDPSMRLALAPEQFRSSYHFGVPADHWIHHFLSLIVPQSALPSLRLNGMPIDTAGFRRIAGSGMWAGDVAVETGYHEVTCSAPFGLAMNGLNRTDSYGHIVDPRVPALQDLSLSTLAGPTTAQVGEQVCLEVNVAGPEGPRPGVRVDLAIPDSPQRLLHGTSDQNGVAQFCYRGLSAGIQIVTAKVGNVTQPHEIQWVEDGNARPAIISEPAAVAFVEHPYTHQLVTVGSHDSLQLAQAPAGMSLDPQGLLQWNPSLDQLGTHPVRLYLKAGDRNLAMLDFKVLVTGKNNRPPHQSKEPRRLGFAYVDVSYTARIDVRDPEGNAIRAEVLQGPPGMFAHGGHNNQYAVAAITPTADTVGTHRVGLRIHDDHGGYFDFYYDLVIKHNTPVQVLQDPFPQARVGVRYQSQLVFSDPDTEQSPIRVFLKDGQAPGFGINQYNGIIDFTPRYEGRHQVVVTLHDSVSAHEYTFPFTIAPADAQLGVGLNMTPQVVGAGEAVSLAAFTTNAANAPSYTATLGQAEIPLADDGTGLFQAPSLPGYHTVTVDADDGDQFATSEALLLVIDPDNAGNHPPVFQGQPQTDAGVGSPYSDQIVADDIDGDTLLLVLHQAPDGMRLDAAAGTLSWMPLAHQVGNHAVQLSVYDPYGAADTRFFEITVADDNHPPDILSEPPAFLPVERTLVYKVIASDRDGDGLTYRYVSGPRGSRFYADSGTFQWTASDDQVGPNNVHLRVVDDRGGITDHYFTVVVSIPGPANRRLCR